MERTVRNFRLVEPIGSGGMGMIYRAVQTSLDRPVAIKELHAHLAKDQDFIRRFEREAKSAAALQHENIVGVIDFGQEGDVYFLALEFVDGPDLKTVMASHEAAVPLPVALTIAIDVLRGLEHAHSRGVVHRDIKPANVMVARSGISKVADFSIARAASMPAMTVTGETLGTPAYMSPEQTGGGPISPRSDLFSAGVILYEMIAGKRPFVGDSYPAVLTQVLTTVPKPLDQLDPSVPPAIAKAVARALEKEPDRRFAGAGDLARALEDGARAANLPLGRGLVAEYLKNPRETGSRWRAAQTDPSQSLVAKSATGSRNRIVVRRGGAPWPAIVAVLATGGAVAFLAKSAFFPGAVPSPVATPTVEVAATDAPAATATPEETATETPPATVAQPAPTARAARTPAVAAIATTAAPAETAAQGELVDPEATNGWLKLQVLGSWADVYVDGVKVDTTPIARPLKIAPGTHALRLVNPGYDEHDETVEIRAGWMISRSITLTRKP